MAKKHSQKRKRKKRTKRLKNIDTKLDEIKEYVGKIKKDKGSRMKSQF